MTQNDGYCECDNCGAANPIDGLKEVFRGPDSGEWCKFCRNLNEPTSKESMKLAQIGNLLQKDIKKYTSSNHY